MKSVFNRNELNEILSRIDQLHGGSQAVWGKMNVSQMTAHCIKPLELAMGEATSKPVSIFMRLIGRLVKRNILSPKPYKNNLPTDPSFITVKYDYELNNTKEQLKQTLERFWNKQDTVSEFKHPFFGKLTKTEWGKSQWKHLDHHLRQFGV